MQIVDPAGVYFSDHSPARRGPVYREAAVFGPGVPGGSRQATDEEIRALRGRSRSRPPERADLGALMTSDSVKRAVTELLASGSTVLESPHGQVRARIVRFWRGNSILEIAVEDRNSRVRIPRKLGPEGQETLAFYLGAFLSHA